VSGAQNQAAAFGDGVQADGDITFHVRRSAKGQGILFSGGTKARM
jgi:hypothetical protein